MVQSIIKSLTRWGKRVLIPDRPEEMVGIAMARGPEVTRRLNKLRERLYASPLSFRVMALAALMGCAALTSLGGLRIVQAQEALPPAKQINPAEVPAGARVLHFPADRVLGKVMVNRSRSQNAYFNMPTGTGWDEYEWEYVGEARGDVLIPTGKLVKLQIYPPVVFHDLTALKQLGPDDIHHLEIGYEFGAPGERIPTGFKPDTLMDAISGLKGLKVLNIGYTRITAKGLAGLRNFGSLEYLMMPQGSGDESLAVAGERSSLKGLYFRFRDCRLSRKGVASIARLPNLEEFLLTAEGYNDATIAPLASAPSLKLLQLAGSQLTDRAMETVAKIRTLKSVDVRSSNITEKGLALLARSPSIEEIALIHSTQISDAGLECLKKMPHLKTLRLGSQSLTNRAAETLSQINTIETLDLRGGGPSGPGMDDGALIALARLPRLRSLSLSPGFHWDPKENKISFTRRGLAALAGTATLTSLEIGGVGIDDAALAEIGKMSSLNHLSLMPVFSVTNAGLAQLNSLKSLEFLAFEDTASRVTLAGFKLRLEKLKQLNIDNFVQDDSGLDLSGMPGLERLFINTHNFQSLTDADLAGIAKLKNLRGLVVNQNELATDRGLAHIGGMASLSETLRIGSGRFSDEGMKSIARLQNLGMLNIRGNIGDAGLAELAKMRSLTNLEVVTTGQFGPEGMDKIKNGLPLVVRPDVLSEQANYYHPTAVGEDGRDLKLKTLDGKQIQLSKLGNKVIMLHFWASWDRRSVAELAQLKEVNARMNQKFPGRFMLISVAQEGDEAAWREFVTRQKLDWTQARSQLSGYSYQIHMIPSYFLLSSEGKVLLNPASSWKNIDAVIAKELGNKF